MSRVYTEDTCGRCGKTEAQEGAIAGMPFIGWSELRLTRRNKGNGWTNHTRVASMHLCPDCAEAVRQFVGKKNAEKLEGEDV